MPKADGARSGQPHFVRLCKRLETIGTRIPIKARRTRDRDRSVERLAAAIDLTGMEVDAETVVSAARTCVALGAILAAILIVPAVGFLGSQYLVLIVVSLAVSVLMVREVILSFPESVAKKQADELMRASPEMANLMIMSLRHEPSLSKAIRFASTKDNAFSHELRRCVWTVVMGKHSSFEESLQEVGERWSKYCDELKASLHSMVTASCESTADGKRRALDRANQAMISGAKRRIEDYALSLSTPSMIMFGLGILLPLMVGSFLPMLSWDIWSLGGGADESAAMDQSHAVVQTVFIMNVLFPAIGILVALNSVTRHPLERERMDNGNAPPSWIKVAAVVCASIGLVTFCVLELDGIIQSLAILVAAVAPGALFLIATGRSPGDRHVSPSNVQLEDTLFRTGARMLEGENFESALNKASQDAPDASSRTTRMLSFRSLILGEDFGPAPARASCSGGSNALEGLRVVREAATKDELAAGLLAMDIASYLKDLRDLESTLKSRLKPTISMMRMTSYALGPVVLGITYAIYLSLGGVTASGTGGIGAGIFLLVLGAFLAETNAVVTYFLWGLEGGKNRSTLFCALGTCILVSEIVYVTTALVAS
ncbi:MAG: hypothetical protein KJ672_04350 [Candidatus Thermoplasmatota archaeon]|nr:hypothetical protein [Candidatus Thermoplasmatota archaeon]